jgi:hypothetical protein
LYQCLTKHHTIKMYWWSEGIALDHSPPSSAEVELYLHSPIRLHGVVLYNFTLFYFTLLYKIKSDHTCPEQNSLLENAYTNPLFLLSFMLSVWKCFFICLKSYNILSIYPSCFQRIIFLFISLSPISVFLCLRISIYCLLSLSPLPGQTVVLYLNNMAAWFMVQLVLGAAT